MNSFYAETTEELKTSVLKGLCFLFIIASIITFSVNFIRSSNLIFTIIDFSLIIIYSSLLFFIHKYGIRAWCKGVIVYSYILAISYVTMAGNLDAGLLNWVFTIPVMLYFLYPKKHAFIVSFIIMFLQTVNVYYSASYGHAEAFRGIPNFVLAYGLVWLLANIYETSNNTMKFKIIDQATKDPLTRALNRRALQLYFNSMNSDDVQVSLCMLDVDFFKKINDKYGHDSGDLVLIELVKILTEQTSSAQVYRIGGEEFVILCDGDLSTAISKMKQVLHVINSTSYDEIHQELTLSFSAGVVQLDNNKSMSDILKQADHYLYQAKNSGRNKIMSELD